MKQYTERPLVLLNWPRAQYTADGSWLRVWHVHFKDTIDPQFSMESLSTQMSGDDFGISLVQDGSHDVRVHVVTHKRHGESDKVVLANYELLVKLNEKIGTIATIQGQERDVWLPWRNRLQPS
jgi:hypothetical protein